MVTHRGLSTEQYAVNLYMGLDENDRSAGFVSYAFDVSYDAKLPIMITTGRRLGVQDPGAA